MPSKRSKVSRDTKSKKQKPSNENESADSLTKNSTPNNEQKNSASESSATESLAANVSNPDSNGSSNQTSTSSVTVDTKTNSAIWAGYSKLRLKDGKRVADCKICKKTVCVAEGTTNAWTHYKHRHPSDWAKLSNKAVKHSSVKKFTVSLTPQHQSEAKDVLRAVTMMVTSHNLSPEIASSAEFQEVLTKTRNLAPHVSSIAMSSDTIKKDIHAVFDLYWAKLRDTVKKIDSRISFTTDGWSSSTRRPFLGVTASWIDEDFKLNSVTFDFIEIKGGHSGSNIAQTFFDCVQKLGAHEKIGGITVDNASANDTFICELDMEVNHA